MGKYKVWRLLALWSFMLTCCLTFHLLQSTTKRLSTVIDKRLQMVFTRKWSAEEDSLLKELFDKQESISTIAQTMNRSSEAVKTRYCRKFITRSKPASRRPLDLELMKKVAPLHANGTLSWCQIQEAYFPERSYDYVRKNGRRALEELDLIDSLSYNRWSDEDSELLKRGVAKYGTKWKKIAAEFFPSRSPHNFNRFWAKAVTKEPKLQLSVSRVTRAPRTTAEIDIILKVAHLKKEEGMTWKEIQQAYYPNRSIDFVKKVGYEALGGPSTSRRSWSWIY